MMVNSSLLAAVLPVVSVVSLSLLYLLCLRCKRKSKVIHEDHQIYNPQTFQRGGSVFAVTQSKTVTRANQRTSTTVDTGDEFEDYTSATDDQSDYINVTNGSYFDSAAQTGSSEHTYVDPLPNTLYANEETEENVTAAVETPAVYGNITNYDDDYENSLFLKQKEDDDEPDYVNENGD